ncbi:putative glycosyltransferase protein [Fulvivirga imtechensis AK7]|uniref:Putative glycosyltransferase protein n=1 Tax=Fulvivirga imtechensis AK7 TaxID=1237149 RepID=L8JW50_9BACT|nr:glycosyltransferase family 4 protein [Fulvivirga imtechensis]ELR72428.1 putative glycosyltransferase protein [Fulvivirga imtechensis AK7]
MRIFIIHQYFKTPEEGGAIRSFYIAEWLAARGHEVEVITAYNEKHYRKKQIKGFHVHYLPVYYTNHLSFLSRIHAFYRFVRMSLSLFNKLPRPDLNYVITTPLTTGLIALYAKKRRGIPYVFEVGDLWPDAPIALGVLRNKLLKKLAYKLEKISYENASALIALSPDIKRAIEKKIPGREVAVITNMADTRLFSLEQKNSGLQEKFGVQNRFVIVYAGTVGLANHLEYLLDIAALDKEHHLHFIVAGEGARWDAVRQEAEVRALKNISFYSFMDKLGVNELMNIADAIFVSFKHVPVLSSGSPNKLFDGLAAGKLIIINFGGWVKSLIEQHKCGFSYPPGQPRSFFNKIEPYLADPGVLRKAQQNARGLADEFTPEKQLKELDKVIAGLKADKD